MIVHYIYLLKEQLVYNFKMIQMEEIQELYLIYRKVKVSGSILFLQASQEQHQQKVLDSLEHIK